MEMGCRDPSAAFFGIHGAHSHLYRSLFLYGATKVKVWLRKTGYSQQKPLFSHYLLLNRSYENREDYIYVSPSPKKMGVL